MREQKKYTMSAEFQACSNQANAKLPEDFLTEANAGLARALDAMGIEACKSVQAGGGGLSIFPPAVAAVAANVSVGCEQVVATFESIARAQTAISCAINTKEQSASSEVRQEQDIRLIIENVSIDCGINISQEIKSRSLHRTAFTSEEMSYMSTQLQDSVESLKEHFQEASKGYANGSDGQKILSNMASTAEQVIRNNRFSETVQQVLTSAFASQTLDMVIRNSTVTGQNYSNLDGEPCLVIGQKIQADYVASNMMSLTLSEVFDSEAGTAYKNWFKTEQSSETEGAGEALGGLFSGLLSAILAPLIIVVIVIVVIVVLVAALRGGGMNSIMSSTGGTPGDRGRKIAIGVMVIGGIALLVAIILFLIGDLVGWGVLMIIMCVLFLGLGGYLFWRARRAAKPAT